MLFGLKGGRYLQGRPTIGDAGGEFEYIRRLTSGAELPQGIIELGPGHDCAIIKSSHRLAVTTDMFVEGVHFRRDWIGPEDIGWRSAIASLSDIAASGAEPKAGFLSIGIPEDMPSAEADAAGRGVLSALENFGAALAGGDTVRSQSGLILNLCLIGELTGASASRSGAKPGDLLCVTGRLGGSRAAMLTLNKLGRDLAYQKYFSLIKCYRRPTARMLAGKWLNNCSSVRAIMDISDGLASDVCRIAESSGVGAEIYLDELPYHADIIPVSGIIGENPKKTALFGGEDFELLFAADPEGVEQAVEDLLVYAMTQACVVGRFTDNPELVTVDENGSREPLEKGFAHF